MIAAVVLLAHGDAEAVGVPCRRGFAVAVGVLAAGAPIAYPAKEMIAELDWPASAGLVPVAPELPVLVADVVLAGFGVVLWLDDGVGVGVGVGDPVGVADPVGVGVADGDCLGGDE